MYYTAYVHHEGKYWLAEFPDAPGCQTFADTEDDLRGAAQEALESWLEAHLVSGSAPDRPHIRYQAPVAHKLLRIHVGPQLSIAVNLRWIRQEAGLSQAELAKRVGVSQQQIAKLENPDENPTLRTIEKVSRALGLEIEISFAPAGAAAMIADWRHGETIVLVDALAAEQLKPRMAPSGGFIISTLSQSSHTTHQQAEDRTASAQDLRGRAHRSSGASSAERAEEV